MRRKIAVISFSVGLGVLGLSNITQAQQLPVANNNEQPWYNCRTREVWSPQKQAWCQKVEILKNANYQLANFGSIQLKNGTYENRAKYTRATFIDRPGAIAFGDFNRDGKEDAAALVTVDYGASGIFVYLTAIQDIASSKNATSVLLGDRVNVQSISTNAGQIEVQMIKHRPDEPLCCPTLPVTQTYALRGKLVLIAESTAKTSERNNYAVINLNQIASKVSLTGSDPKAIALAAFGIKEQPEGNFQQTVTMQKNSQTAIVTLSQIGLADDSVRGRRYLVEFQPQKTNSNQPQWRMIWAGMQQICQPGRGSQVWTTKRCS